MIRYIFVVVLIVCVLGAPDPHKKKVKNLPTGPTFKPLGIIGGKKTDIGTIPYQVSIEYLDEHNCGGSIINENTILTAAHCTREKFERHLKVHAGDTSVSATSGQTLNVKKMIDHENFDFKTYNQDVSLLRLDGKLKLNAQVKPIKLADKNTKIPDNVEALVSGWGLTSLPGHYADELHSVKVPLWSFDDCKKAHGAQFNEYMICAAPKEGGKDACYRDSGGPLVWNGIQIGIVSWGNECAKAGDPGVYAHVGKLRDWIEKTLPLLDA